MVLDSSAILAVLFDEPERRSFTLAIERDPKRTMSAANLLESALLIEARRGEAAGRELDLLLHRAAVRIVPVDAEQVEIARAAWRRFGKGRHPAALNFGDCFAYALAKSSGEPLLFKGEDFARTDLVAVELTEPGG
ncbi:MAG TPA: type II toxin-antitoxin system VapC family toxin [Solirubrobacteraceae bacterium]|jgi:ribonuclease VapC|nr:type II toxin-antitoxin system VapC family toxin [Solirubrobacteraceae bacterium]